MRDYDSWKLREEPEYMIECPKHWIMHNENRPCPECYDRYEKAQGIKFKRKKIRELRSAMHKSRESSGWFDAVAIYQEMI